MAYLTALFLHTPVESLSLSHDNEIACHTAGTELLSAVNILRIDHMRDIFVNRKSVLG
jgi:hypothetical protein